VRFECLRRCKYEFAVGQKFSLATTVPAAQLKVRGILESMRQRTGAPPNISKATMTALSTRVESTDVRDWPLDQRLLLESQRGPIVLDADEIKTFLRATDGSFGRYQFRVSDKLYDVYLSPWLPGENLPPEKELGIPWNVLLHGNP